MNECVEIDAYGLSRMVYVWETRTENEPPFFPSGDSSIVYTPEEEYDMVTKQVFESEGFDIDFSNLRCLFNFRPVCLDESKPEHEQELMNMLAQEALEKHNEEKNKKLEFVNVVKANYHPFAGLMFFITFEAKDPEDHQIKLYQAKVCHFYSYGTFHKFCRPKPYKKDIQSSPIHY